MNSSQRKFTHFLLESKKDEKLIHSTEHIDGSLFLVTSVYQNGRLQRKIYERSDDVDNNAAQMLKYAALAIDKLNFESESLWNPLTNDVEATHVLKLIEGILEVTWCASVVVKDYNNQRVLFSESISTDRNKAIRKAIVRAAAYIGQQKMCHLARRG